MDCSTLHNKIKAVVNDDYDIKQRGNRLMLRMSDYVDGDILQQLSEIQKPECVRIKDGLEGTLEIVWKVEEKWDDRWDDPEMGVEI